MNIIEQRLAKLDIKRLLSTDHPMVREFEFVPRSSTRSTSKHADGWVYGDESFYFAIRIHLKPGVVYLQQRDGSGVRITPVKRVTTGLEEVGQGNRVLTIQDGGIVAENSTFFPNQEFNDLGIGSSFYVAQERLYRALGVRHVRLVAAAVGRYVWARQGFKFLHTEQALTLGSGFRGFLRKCGIPSNGRFRHSWDLVNYHVPGAEREGDRIGKFFALQTFPVWEGFKRLDSAEHNDVAVASRKETFSHLPDRIEGAADNLTSF